ncbi:glucose dehydrogenase [FAD, quinone]-like [Planococcus citri]|uniref:glucose dehydrogenase [FAD, quinone]-like n=1 Tax=Planococcus citri TaxID=170843 RepID=UPI0031F828E6
MTPFNRNTTLAVVFIALVFKCAHSFLLLPLLGASLYQAYLEQGINFRENIFLGDKPILEEYDFIVVGAGPGGAVVANRLSEVGHWKILLLEAGEDEHIYTDIPAIAAHWSFSNFNWGYKAERTANACLAMVDQRCPWPRGKGMGGSSILNYMIYTRGHRQDYDDYAAAGNHGWGYDDVLPYFLKSENNSIPEYENSTYHSHNGYLHVERPRHKTILVDAFLEGGKELGYETIDYTEPTQHGFSRIQATTRKGRRCSASKAYLKSVKFRRNLHVSIQSRVTKILIDPQTKNAYGVEFVKKRRKRVVFARKEVILSAGSLNSPQLLMLSGIGPKEHLKELNIPVIQDLRVGENLNEHYTTVGLSFLINQTGAALLEKRLTLKVFADWLNNGRNLLTIPGGVEGIGYTRTKYATESGQRPDMEFIFASASLASDHGDIRRSFGVSDCYFDQILRHYQNKDTWTILPMLLHPRTRGKILLRDKNPWHAPKFFYNYFEDEHDLKVMVEGVKEIIKLSETNAFQRIGTKLNPARLPQCSQHAYKSDEYWGCFIRYFTGTLHHQCGTCKMGPSTDKSAVVDPELRVYGINNLRVVDSSIFPKVPGAHLYAPTLMVGEKASDMIRKHWLKIEGINYTTTPLPTDRYYKTSTVPCLSINNQTYYLNNNT